MDKWILYILCLLFIGCVNAGKKELTESSGPFSPVMKQKIRDFIHYVDSVYPENDEWFYAFNAMKVGDTSYINIRTELYYCTGAYHICGYSYLDGKLIVFEDAPGPMWLKSFKLSDSQFFIPEYLVDTAQLIKFRKYIPGYWDGRRGIGDYEPLLYKYQLIGRDSLVLRFARKW